MLRWMMALAGLFLAVFAVVALSGPGENDVADGYVRYEVARSLVEHGDVDIPDPKIWFTVFPGATADGTAITGSPSRPRACSRSWPPMPPGR